MESLLAAAFGRVVDVQKGEADEVTNAARKLFGFAKRKLFLFIFLILCEFTLQGTAAAMPEYECVPMPCHASTLLKALLIFCTHI